MEGRGERRGEAVGPEWGTIPGAWLRRVPGLKARATACLQPIQWHPGEIGFCSPIIHSIQVGHSLHLSASSSV